mgnify:CR=1 FL=1
MDSLTDLNDSLKVNISSRNHMSWLDEIKKTIKHDSSRAIVELDKLCASRSSPQNDPEGAMTKQDIVDCIRALEVDRHIQIGHVLRSLKVGNERLTAYLLTHRQTPFEASTFRDQVAVLLGKRFEKVDVSFEKVSFCLGSEHAFKIMDTLQVCTTEKMSFTHNTYQL